jgi:Ca-activated chloride channel homolog
MNFLWPQNLWLLLALPLLPALYLWLLRRRTRAAVRLSSLAIVRRALGPRWRRHVPPALVLLALGVLLLALARPTAAITLPWARTTVMLALDISLSMRVKDVEPTRMAAAQQAARGFLAELPPHVEVGIVTFAANAQLAQRPTTDRAALVGAVDAIQMQIGTAIGSAIVVCLAELFPEHNLDTGEAAFGHRRGARSLDARSQPPPQLEPVAPGSYDAAAIILLSDGRRTMGVDTLQAARLAADRGVRIDVVGLGTPDGHASAGEGMAMYLQLDEATLREVARMTGGDYHHAGTAQALLDVYRGLGSRLQVGTRDTEITALLAGVGALLLAGAATLSLAWFGRVS